jgi:diguanylate cyclase
VSVLAGVYPLFDVLLVLLLASLAFTTSGLRPSYVLLLCGLCLLLAGDLAYAIIGVAGDLTGSPLLDVPFLLTFTLIGSAALHPSIADLGKMSTVPVQGWSWRRLLLIGPALVVPFVLTAIAPSDTTASRVVIAVCGVAMVALLLTRAVSAVQDYAAARLQAEHDATHDPLTGLPNRLMLSSEVSRLLATSPSVGGESTVWVLFLDLDGFKLVNDS